MGGNVVVTGVTLNCDNKYKRKGTKSKRSGMINNQMLHRKLVGTGTTPKFPAPCPTYLYVVSCRYSPPGPT